MATGDIAKEPKNLSW